MHRKRRAFLDQVDNNLLSRRRSAITVMSSGTSTTTALALAPRESLDRCREAR